MPEGLLAWLGGPAVQHRQPAGLLDHDHGFSFAWPTCPALGREGRTMSSSVRPILAVHDCPPLMALCFVTGQEITLVMRIAFDREREERRAAILAMREESAIPAR